MSCPYNNLPRPYKGMGTRLSLLPSKLGTSRVK
jgi:hypothetical protein